VNDDETAIISWIKDNCTPDTSMADLALDTPLLEQGLLDSIQIVQMVNFLETQFAVKVDVDDLVPENFQDIKSILAMITKRRP
jgi:acyl carrier protein